MTRSHAERQRRYRRRRRAGEAKTAYRTPKDRRSRGPRLHDALATILAIREEYRDGRQALPETLETTATAELLDPALEALDDRDLDSLAELELPRGFGRDGCVRPGQAPVRTGAVGAPAMGLGRTPR